MGLGTCIVVIPQDAVGDEHLTLVYSGEYVDRNVLLQLDELTRSMANLHQPFEAYVTGVSHFGDQGEVEVYNIGSPILEAMRFLVAPYALSSWGFSPHITQVRGSKRAEGEIVRFNRLGLWINEDQTNYQLGTGARRA